MNVLKNWPALAEADVLGPRADGFVPAIWAVRIRRTHIRVLNFIRHGIRLLNAVICTLWSTSFRTHFFASRRIVSRALLMLGTQRNTWSDLSKGAHELCIDRRALACESDREYLALEIHYVWHCDVFTILYTRGIGVP